jgi:hypothetical protein
VTARALLLGLVLVLGGAIRFHALGGQSFGLDETFTVRAVDRPFLGMLLAVGQTEASPPVYYVLAWVWAQLFGSGEAGLRSLSALLGSATIVVTFAAARHFTGPRGALVAAAVVACNPLLVWYSQEARSYALVVFVGALTVLLFARAREAPTARRLGLWAAACVLAVLTHYLAVFLVVCQALLLWRALPERRRAVTRALVGIGAIGLAIAPVAYLQVSQGRVDWITAIPLRERVGAVVLELASANALLPRTLAPPRTGLPELLALAAVWGAVALLVRRLDSGERARAGAVAAMGAGVILLVLALSLTGVDFFLDRNLIVAWVPLAIALAAVLAGVRAGWLGLAAAGVLCLGGIAANLEVSARPALQRSNWRAVSRALGPPQGLRVVVMSPRYVAVPLAAYGQELSRCPRGVEAREVVIVEALPPPRLPPPERLRLASRVEFGQLAVRRFLAPAPVLVALPRSGRSAPRSSSPRLRRRIERRTRPAVACQAPAGNRRRQASGSSRRSNPRSAATSGSYTRRSMSTASGSGSGLGADLTSVR